MVEKEMFIDANITNNLAMKIVYCERHAAGGWSVVLRITGDVTLPDGRVLPVDRGVSLGSILQEGRKSQRRGFVKKGQE